jgi:hypothetical protein
MYNQFTDRYRFVEVELIKNAPFWGRKILAMEDVSQQIFQYKEYSFTLRPYNVGTESKPLSAKVYKGDTIYKIDMHPHSISTVDSFKTKDNFVRVYDFTLVLQVTNPVIFAKGYSAGQDPVFLVIDEIQKALLKYGEEHEHDKLSKLEQPALDWNNILAEATGVRVQKITKWILHEDKKRLETAEIEQETEKEKLRLQREAETKMIQERSGRERDALQHLYQLHNQLSTTAANELKTILQERIRDTFESGQPIDDVAKETMSLLNALYEGIRNFSYSNGAFHAKNGASSGANGSSTGAHGGSYGGNGTGSGGQGNPSGGNGTGTRTGSVLNEEDTTILAGTMTGSANDNMPPLDDLKRNAPGDTDQ